MNNMLKLLAGGLTLAGLTLHPALAEDPAAPAPVPRTGQTPSAPLNPAPKGADGALEKGVAWPSPRFIDRGDGAVTDALTGLVWLQNATCTDTVGGVNKEAGTLKWSQALAWSNALASGKCGLTDGSVAGDWRLPNLRELESLIDLSQSGPALPAVRPFLNVWSGYYWSSSTVALATSRAWTVNLNLGDPGRFGKATRQGVWPVRDALPPPNLAIGDFYQGGIVFYVEYIDGGSGAHGLIAAPQDLGDGILVPWWNGSFLRTGAGGTAVGKGQDNTDNIVAVQGAGDYAASRAANLVLNGYSDWFLPSKDELNLMYWRIGQGAPAPLTNIGGFENAPYWSSSEYDRQKSWFQAFTDHGTQQEKYFKNQSMCVRAVRAF